MGDKLEDYDGNLGRNAGNVLKDTRSNIRYETKERNKDDSQVLNLSK
jgi:hypothetical protein